MTKERYICKLKKLPAAYNHTFTIQFIVTQKFVSLQFIVTEQFVTLQFVVTQQCAALDE